jgi:hypothetical protein
MSAMQHTEKRNIEDLKVKYAHLLANKDLMSIVNDKNPNSADPVNEQLYQEKAVAMASGLFDTYLKICND